MGNIMTRLMVSRWGLHYTILVNTDFMCHFEESWLANNQLRLVIVVPSCSHGQTHKPDPIGPGGIGHTQSCSGHHFLAWVVQAEGQSEGRSAARTSIHME